MNNFVFYNPTKLIFGKETIASLTKEISTDKKIMITFGSGSVRQNGVYEQVTTALKNHQTIEFWGIEPNPSYEVLSKAIQMGKENNIDFLLAVGGGSVIDGTKFIAAGIPYEGDSWDLIKNNSLVRSTIPLASVLTLPATGSEMNNGAVISRKSTHEKYAFFAGTNFPVFSILDPQVTYSLPKFQIACGLVDTFVHVAEQYITYPSQALVMDRFAEGILLSVIEVAPKVLANQTDYDNMSNYMLSATMALNGFISMGVPQDWATHMIGHELTALKGLTHAVTLAIVYPAMLKVMKTEKHAKLLQYAACVWNIKQGSESERINEAIEKTEAFFRSLNIPTRLSEVGVDDAIINEIVNRFEQRKAALGENASVTPSTIKQILNTAI